jgi:hypothetical protein
VATRTTLIDQKRSDIHALGTDFTEKSQYLLHDCQMSLHLVAEWGILGRLEDNFERFRMLVGWSGEDAGVASGNDGSLGGMRVDFGTTVAGKYF